MADRPVPKAYRDDRLARVLFEEMEKLDPTEGGDRGWDGLTERDRDFYWFCVEAMIAAYKGAPTTT